jgi:hypothetical protein
LILVCNAASVLVDSSCFVNFAGKGDPGHLLGLIAYLKDRTYASIVDEVEREIARLSGLRDRRQKPKHPGLAMWPNLRDRPARVSVHRDYTHEMADMIRALRQPGDHPLAHYGEAATIVKAKETGAVAILDDRGAKALAKPRGVDFISTPQLVAQMVIDRGLSETDGLTVYGNATPDVLQDGSPYPVEAYFRGELLHALRAFKDAGLR